jgi:hypothetical protein
MIRGKYICNASLSEPIHQLEKNVLVYFIRNIWTEFDKPKIYVKLEYLKRFCDITLMVSTPNNGYMHLNRLKFSILKVLRENHCFNYFNGRPLSWR